MAPGYFITFEGVDGCGKTTQMHHASSWLSQQGIVHVATREPGGTPIAEKVRGILLSPEHKEMTVPTEVLLYLAARAQHVAQIIRPALDQGKIVLCDRFSQATFAYQGYGRGIVLDALRQLNSFATGGLEPALTFIFDIPLSVAYERLKATGKQPDRLEGEGREFHERIRRGYQALAQAQPDRIVMIDGGRASEEVAKDVEQRLATMVESGRKLRVES